MSKKEILIKKCDITKKIYTCTKEINKAIDKKDTQEILELLELRQNFINESNKIDSEIKKFIKEAEDDSKIRKILDKINTVLRKIKDIDDENRRKSSHFTDTIKGKISDLKQTGNAMKGYGIIGKGTASEGAFIDTKH